MYYKYWQIVGNPREVLCIPVGGMLLISTVLIACCIVAYSLYPDPSLLLQESQQEVGTFFIELSSIGRFVSKLGEVPELTKVCIILECPQMALTVLDLQCQSHFLSSSLKLPFSPFNLSDEMPVQNFPNRAKPQHIAAQHSQHSTVQHTQHIPLIF